MASYLVTWEIDAEADSPEAAARWAWETMRKPGSTANVFTVTEESGEQHKVDLQEIEETAVDVPLILPFLDFEDRSGECA